MNNDTATYHAHQERGDGHMGPGEGAAWANGSAARQPEIDALKAEIEQLRTQLDNERAAHQVACQERDEMAAEIERLRAALAEMLVQFVADHKAGNISTMPATVQRIVRNAEALLAFEQNEQKS